MKKTMTFNQFLEEFRDDHHHEWVADQEYWETRELNWQESLRDDYIEYCKAEGIDVVFD